MHPFTLTVMEARLVSTVSCSACAEERSGEKASAKGSNINIIFFILICISNAKLTILFCCGKFFVKKNESEGQIFMHIPSFAAIVLGKMDFASSNNEVSSSIIAL